jgi:hypothetical protein
MLAHQPRVPLRSHLNLGPRASNGQPRTYRLAPSPTQESAYRRLAATILSLDVATLADQLRSARANG